MSLLYSIFMILSLFAAVFDFLVYRIPNILVIGILIIAVPMLTLLTSHQIYFTLIIGCIVLAIGFVFTYLGWLGAGDAKLLFASSIWMAPLDIVGFIFLMALIGGVLAGVYLAFGKRIDIVRKKLTPLVARALGTKSSFSHYFSQPFVQTKSESLRHTKIPYGIAIATASITISLIHWGSK